MLDVGLKLWVGTIEVGLVGTSGGRVVFAELPGATGNDALILLASLSDARVVPEAWTARVTNVEGEWRTLIGDRELASSPARAQRIASARASLAELVPDDVQAAALASQARESVPRGLRLALEVLDWAAITAYLGGELDRAQRLLERRAALGAIDGCALANLERVRVRLLDDELEIRLGGGAA